MEVITIRDQIRSVAKRFRKSYERSLGELSWKCDGQTRGDIADELDAMDAETAGPEDVERIIGNASWIGLTCHDCGGDVEAVIQLGEPMDYESQTAHVCAVCIAEAFGKMQRYAPR